MARPHAPSLSWIDQLGFARKMTLLGLLALLPLAITVAMLLNTATKDIRMLSHQRASLDVVQALMPVVRTLQDHRGASRTWLAGDASFKSRVDSAAVDVQAKMAAADAVVSGVRERVDVSADWSALTARWRTLAERNPKLSPAESFKEHTALIEAVLRLFGSAADRGELLNQPDAAALRLADVLIERLPRLAERVGQTRGFGAGLLARDADSITPDERARLLSLVAGSRDLAEDAQNELGHARAGDPSLESTVSTVLGGLKSVSTFLLMAEERVAQSSAGRPTAAAYFEAGTVSLKSVFEAQDALLPELSKRLDLHGAQVWRSAALMLSAVILSLAVCALMAWWVYRRLRWALDAAVSATASIAQGRLDVSVPQGGRDEFGTLLKTLAEMTQSLRTVVGGVSTAAREIDVAVTEVATGNVDLSQRTEQQAAHLQQTSSSMEQLTGTVANNAENARQANQLALGASEVARRGGEVVEQVVATMGQISESSRKIADIIGVIDGIAFQTNILALNAAVEAARAGEQGRGFSVVAAEVRNLAQRSAQAAHQIKALITDSVQRVDSGGRLVQDAGATMQDIVTSVRRVTDIIGEISSATAEQSAGIAQVNVSVGELDRMTQQNAALVEEGAAASESLKEQANRLLQSIDHFRLEGADSARRTQVPVSHVSAPASRPVAKVAPAAVSAPPRQTPSTASAIASSPASSVKPTRSSTAGAEARSPDSVPSVSARPAPRAAVSGSDDDWEEF